MLNCTPGPFRLDRKLGGRHQTVLLASYPGSRRGERRAWCTLFAHAPKFPQIWENSKFLHTLYRGVTLSLLYGEATFIQAPDND